MEALTVTQAGGDLKLFCTNTAIADANSNIIPQNAATGQLGTLGLRPIHGPGNWDMDANLQKTIRISESRNLTFRLDAANIFNHPCIIVVTIRG